MCSIHLDIRTPNRNNQTGAPPKVSKAPQKSSASHQKPSTLHISRINSRGVQPGDVPTGKTYKVNLIGSLPVVLPTPGSKSQMSAQLQKNQSLQGSDRPEKIESHKLEVTWNSPWKADSVISMAYMGQTLNSPIINKLASQVKCQEPVKTDPGWESSENAEQKLEAHNRGSFIFLTVWVILNPGFPVIHTMPFPPPLLPNKRGFYLGF